MKRLVPSAACVICIVLVGCQTKDAEHEQSAGAQHLTSEIPFSESDEADIRDQIERNWNLGSLAGSPNLKGLVVKLRIGLLPDGTVTRTELLNGQPDNPDFRKVADSAIRAVMISSPLRLGPGKSYKTMVLMFHPDQTIE